MSANEVRYSVSTSVVLMSLIENLMRIFTMGMKCVTIIALGMCTYYSIDTLAGRQTDAQIAVLIGYLNKSEGNAVVVVSLFVGLLGVLYGYLQRRLRLRTISDFAAYRMQIEGPNRTSSQLDHQGQTNPQDR